MSDSNDYQVTLDALVASMATLQGTIQSLAAHMAKRGLMANDAAPTAYDAAPAAFEAATKGSVAALAAFEAAPKASVAALATFEAAPNGNHAAPAAFEAAPKAHIVAALAAIKTAPKTIEADPDATSYNPHPIDCRVVTNPTAEYAKMNRRIHSMETAISRIRSTYVAAIAQIATTRDSNLGLRFQVQELRAMIKLTSKPESYGGGTISDTQTKLRHHEGSAAGTSNRNQRESRTNKEARLAHWKNEQFALKIVPPEKGGPTNRTFTKEDHPGFPNKSKPFYWCTHHQMWCVHTAAKCKWGM